MVELYIAVHSIKVNCSLLKMGGGGVTMALVNIDTSEVRPVLYAMNDHRFDTY